MQGLFSHGVCSSSVFLYCFRHQIAKKQNQVQMDLLNHHFVHVPSTDQGCHLGHDYRLFHVIVSQFGVGQSPCRPKNDDDAHGIWETAANEFFLSSYPFHPQTLTAPQFAQKLCISTTLEHFPLTQKLRSGLALCGVCEASSFVPVSL